MADGRRIDHCRQGHLTVLGDDEIDFRHRRHQRGQVYLAEAGLAGTGFDL
jgi:hypothetical protein